jgi:hypothetical protein
VTISDGKNSGGVTHALGYSHCPNFEENAVDQLHHQRHPGLVDGDQRHCEVREAGLCSTGIYAAVRLPRKPHYPIGILELACVVLYLIPRTSVLGAILVTGYLGGATVTHLRVGDPAFVGAVIAGIFVWGGLFFREPQVRALIPFRNPNTD